jgi:hypothetical protein
MLSISPVILMILFKAEYVNYFFQIRAIPLQRL